MTDPSTQECRRNHWRIWTTTRDSVSCPICKWERDYEFAPEPDRPTTQPALEMANDAIRYLAREAAEIPLRVAEELGLTAKLSVTQNAYTVLSLPRDTGVRLRVSHDRIQLAMVRHRRWWQFWRPKVWTAILAEKPYRVRAGDTVQLTQGGMVYTVMVNDRKIIRYPLERPNASRPNISAS